MAYPEKGAKYAGSDRADKYRAAGGPVQSPEMMGSQIASTAQAINNGMATPPAGAMPPGAPPAAPGMSSAAPVSPAGPMPPPGGMMGPAE